MNPRQHLTDPLDGAERELLLARARKLGAVAELAEAEAVDQVWLAEFRLGDSLYGIPLEQLRGCGPLRGVTAVPLAPADVVGFTRFEGAVVTVLSLSALVNERSWLRDPSVILLLEPTPGRLVAVDCEQIPVPTTVALSRISSARARVGEAAVVPVLLEDGRQLHLIDFARALEARPADVNHGR